MKQFIDKLISRLENHCKTDCNGFCSTCDFKETFEIVKKLAEEYKGKYVSRTVLEQFKWERDIAIEQLEALGYGFCQKVGWIPCEVRLPEEDGKRYMVQKTNGFIDILGFTKNAYKLSRYDFAEYKGKEKPLFYDYDSEYGYTEWECEAWMPLPAPYKEGMTENE